MSLDVTLYYEEEGAEDLEVFDANYTHNIIPMAKSCGIYTYVWHPEDADVEKAEDLLEPLRTSIRRLRSNPDKYEKLNPENKWGDYISFIAWLNEYYKACESYPSAKVKTHV